MWAFTAIRWVSSWSLHNFPYVSFYVRPPTICHRWNRRCVRLAKPPFYGYGLYNKRNQTGIKFNELRELSLNLPLSARNFEPTGNSVFFFWAWALFLWIQFRDTFGAHHAICRVSSHSRYRSYLTTYRAILYFRILVPNHLQSLIGQREIRRSLNGLDSRSARTKAI